MGEPAATATLTLLIESEARRKNRKVHIRHPGALTAACGALRGQAVVLFAGTDDEVTCQHCRKLMA